MNHEAEEFTQRKPTTEIYDAKNVYFYNKNTKKSVINKHRYWFLLHVEICFGSAVYINAFFKQVTSWFLMRNNRANTRKLISNNSQFALNLFFLKENQMLQIHVTFGVSRLKKIKHDLYHCKRRCVFQWDKTKLPICNIYRVIKEKYFYESSCYTSYIGRADTKLRTDFSLNQHLAMKDSLTTIA